LQLATAKHGEPLRRNGVSDTCQPTERYLTPSLRNAGREEFYFETETALSEGRVNPLWLIPISEASRGHQQPRPTNQKTYSADWCNCAQPFHIGDGEQVQRAGENENA